MTTLTPPFVNQQYIDYIRSAAWKVKRRQVLIRDQFTCQCCKKAIASQVHHKTYIRLYQEDLEDLISICTPCHRLITKAHRSSPALKSAPTIFM
jgi:5-methylcytosine-specific restriction endonuclease McrA